MLLESGGFGPMPTNQHWEDLRRRLLRAQDPTALDTLYQFLSSAARDCAFLFDPEAAHNLLQDVARRLARKVDASRAHPGTGLDNPPIRDFGAYCRVILRNEQKRWIKKDPRLDATCYPGLEEFDNLVSQGRNAAGSRYAQIDLVCDLETCVTKLRPSDQALVRLWLFDEVGVKDMLDVLRRHGVAISRPALESRFKMARRRFRRALRVNGLHAEYFFRRASGATSGNAPARSDTVVSV